jgi:hypothetical protein
MQIIALNAETGSKEIVFQEFHPRLKQESNRFAVHANSFASTFRHLVREFLPFLKSCSVAPRYFLKPNELLRHVFAKSLTPRLTGGNAKH